jgi:Fe-S-cluster containining protein
VSRPKATDPWYAKKGLEFQCTSCGICCKGPDPGWVIVDEVDILRLTEELGMSTTAFGKKYLRRATVNGEAVLSLIEKRNHDCIFWEDGVGCGVYMGRPQQCRAWPFWPEVVESKSAWEAEAAVCPGMNKGRLYERKEIERILQHKRGTLRGRKPKLPIAK